MAGFGGFNPLPLRLGGRDGTTSWTSEDHAALCRDLVAAARVTPFARMIVDVTGSSAATVTEYRGINGNGSDYAPSIVTSLWSPVLTFDPEWIDDQNVRRSLKVASAKATVAGAGAAWHAISEVVSSGGRRTVGIYAGDQACKIQVTVFGCYLDDATIADYGGATDKTNCETEITPCAYSTYRALQDARGSAYSKERGTLVHVENLCLARAHAGTWRRAERLACNANPATADEKAEEWRQVLGVRQRDGDTPAALRTRNAAKLKAALGPTRRVVDDAVAELLGPLYVKTWRNYGSETTADSTGAYWTGVNPGSTSYDLGGGPWYSDRSHIVVEVTHPASVTDYEFNSKMTDLVELLDLLLPATCTFDWCTGADDGFTLDEDLLDEACMGET